MAPALLARAGPFTQLIADRAYDANSLRSTLHHRGVEAVIPSTRSRKRPIPYDPTTYKQRNLIERMFGRLKDFRRIATRYDKLAQNYLAAISLAATVTWWIN
jgi:transposase